MLTDKEMDDVLDRVGKKIDEAMEGAPPEVISACSMRLLVFALMEIFGNNHDKILTVVVNGVKTMLSKHTDLEALGDDRNKQN